VVHAYHHTFVTMTAKAHHAEMPCNGFLQVDQVSKHFVGSKVAALREVSTTFRTDAIKAIVGPNGAGKTTLFRLIAGLIHADSGAVTCFGLGQSAARPRVALLTDSTLGFYPRLSVLQNFRYLAGISSNATGPSSTAAAKQWLDRFNLADRANDECQTLSRGMLQRLALAIALASSCDVLLLDEPTNGLDIEEALRFFQLVKQISRESTHIIAFSSHQPDAILGLADEVSFLIDGSVAGDFSSEQLSRVGAAEFVSNYLALLASVRDRRNSIDSEGLAR
jgi:ABC-2 type transport system ATP-binding protein